MIDGETLPLLSEEHLLDTLGLKLGPALKIRSQVHCNFVLESFEEKLLRGAVKGRSFYRQNFRIYTVRKSDFKDNISKFKNFKNNTVNF